MLILEIDSISNYFKVIDSDNIIVATGFERMNFNDGYFKFYSGDYLYEIPANINKNEAKIQTKKALILLIISSAKKYFVQNQCLLCCIYNFYFFISL